MGKFAALARSALGKGLKLAEVARMAEYFDDLELKAGDSLFGKGDKGSALFLICQGTINLSANDPFGKEGEGAFKVGRGEIVGEISLLRASRRKVIAKALEKTRLLTLSSKGYKRLSQDAPQTHAKLSRNLLQLVGEKMGDLEESL